MRLKIDKNDSRLPDFQGGKIIEILVNGFHVRFNQYMGKWQVIDSKDVAIDEFEKFDDAISCANKQSN